MTLSIREATEDDLDAIRLIYNQGIEDRIATLEHDPKTEYDMKAWFHDRKKRYAVAVAERDGEVAGWVSINPYSMRCAYDGVGDLSIYIHRDYRGRGIGHQLLRHAERVAGENGFYKLVLFTFPFNTLGQSLYRRAGFREVGTFQNQGILDGKFVDIMVMEKVFRT